MIPVLFGAAALVGLGLADDAKTYAREANEFNAEAKSIVENSKADAERAHNDMTNSLSNLGDTQRDIVGGSVKHFVGMMSQIYDFEYHNNPSGLQKLERMGFRKSILDEMKYLTNKATDMSGGGSSYGVDGGSFTEMGVLSGIGAGAASIALGTSMLTVAAPIALLYGWSNRNDAKAARYEALENLDKAKGYREECNSRIAVMSALKTRSDQLNNLLYNLDGYHSWAVDKMEDAVNVNGFDFDSYPDYAVDSVFYAYQLTQTIKIIIEAPLMKDEKTIHHLLDSKIAFGNKVVDRLNRGGSMSSATADIKLLNARNS